MSVSLEVTIVTGTPPVSTSLGASAVVATRAGLGMASNATVST